MGAKSEPFSTKGTDPEALRDKTVVKEATKSFDERTSAAPAWLDENGNQRNGSEGREEVKPRIEEDRAEKATAKAKAAQKKS